MPKKSVKERARKKLREGKSPKTAAGEFVEEEFKHIEEGKHGARSARQAVAIGLSKARRAGIPVKPPKKGEAKRKTRKSAERDDEKGQKGDKPKSKKRAKASRKALEKEPRKAASKKAQSRQGKQAAEKRTAKQRSEAAKKAARTKGPEERSRAAKKAARTRKQKAGGKSSPGGIGRPSRRDMAVTWSWC